jgi:hypothetical protein
VLKSLPRHPADAGVGTVEGFRCHVQHRALVRHLSKQLTQIYITIFKEPERMLHQFPKKVFIVLNLCGRINGGIVGQPFVPQGSKSLTSYRIHEIAFGVGCFASRGFRDSLIVSACPGRWRPIPVGLRSESGVESVGRPMLTQL